MIKLNVNHTFGQFLSMNNKLLLIKYQDNLADNLSAYAQAKIIAQDTQYKCCYENTSKLRDDFEKKMSCFNLECYYISKNRANDINSMAKDKISKYSSKNFYLNLKQFKIDNISKITTELLSEFNFKNTDFLFNYDLLEEIKSENSIGLYINNSDKIQENYIKKATKRLNKYLKNPKLYIFSQNNIYQNLNIDIDYKCINLSNDKEEFYLLTCCKHKIIHNSPNSYSHGFWASILNQKEYNFVIFDKKLKVKNKKHNWIAS